MIPHSLVNRTRLSFHAPLCALTLLAASVQAAVVVDFDGIANSYLTGSNVLIDVGTPSSPNASDRVYAYSTSSFSSPSSGYTGPRFFGGAWMSSTSGSMAGFSSNRIRGGYNNPTTSVLYRTQIEVSLTNHGSTLATGGLLIAFETGANSSNTFGLSSSSALTLEVSTGSQADVRFAILSGTQWYLSESFITPASTTGGTLSLSSGDLSTSLWAAWDPVGGADGRLDAVPTGFDVLGSSLSDIQAVGYYTHLKSATSNQYAYVSRFNADLDPVAVPEPSVAVLLGLGAVMLPLWILKRRRQQGAAQ